MGAMREARAVALSLLAVLGAVAFVAPAPASSPGGDVGPPAAAAAETPTANNSTMGDQVSSFVQATSGQADEEVEAGMWSAAYDNASNRSRIVHRRTADVGDRLAELQRQKQDLIAAYRNGSIDRTEYRARMSRLVGRLAALNRSIDETERQARATGANRTAVEHLRTQARNLSGPEVAAIARSFAGGPPADVARGPPNGTQGPPNGSQGPPNGTQGPPEDRRGPPEDNRTAPGNASGGGQSGEGGGQGGGDGDTTNAIADPPSVGPVRSA